MCFPLIIYKVDLIIAKHVCHVYSGFLQSMFIVYTHCVPVAVVHILKSKGILLPRRKGH